MASSTPPLPAAAPPKTEVLFKFKDGELSIQTGFATTMSGTSQCVADGTFVFHCPENTLAQGRRAIELLKGVRYASAKPLDAETNGKCVRWARTVTKEERPAFLQLFALMEVDEVLDALATDEISDMHFYKLGKITNRYELPDLYSEEYVQHRKFIVTNRTWTKDFKGCEDIEYLWLTNGAVFSKGLKAVVDIQNPDSGPDGKKDVLSPLGDQWDSYEAVLSLRLTLPELLSKELHSSYIEFKSNGAWWNGKVTVKLNQDGHRTICHHVPLDGARVLKAHRDAKRHEHHSTNEWTELSEEAVFKHLPGLKQYVDDFLEAGGGAWEDGGAGGSQGQEEKVPLAYKSYERQRVDVQRRNARGDRLWINFEKGSPVKDMEKGRNR